MDRGYLPLGRSAGSGTEGFDRGCSSFLYHHHHALWQLGRDRLMVMVVEVVVMVVFAYKARCTSRSNYSLFTPCVLPRVDAMPAVHPYPTSDFSAVIVILYEGRRVAVARPSLGVRRAFDYPGGSSI